MKKSLRERMDETSLYEVMPDFDKNREWERLNAHLHPESERRELGWLRAAALILLFVSAGLAILLTSDTGSVGSLTKVAEAGTQRNWSVDMPAYSARGVLPLSTHSHAKGNKDILLSAREETGLSRGIPTGASQSPDDVGKLSHTKEFICNGTPCPLEICIIQKIVCGDGAPSEIATCKTLEPDQARQLHYKAPEGVGADCTVTIDEIRIRRVTTGETIVLNADSEPSTAEELFDCITGQVECNLLAGMFSTDCNNRKNPHKLKVDNSYGDLIVQ